MPAELRLLRAYVSAVEEGSITRAARRLHLAQQSLSGQLRSLERDYGTPLLERSVRGVVPTATGAVLLAEARRLLAHADRADAAVRRAALGQAGELRVGFLHSIANYLMPPVVRALAGARPDIELQARDGRIAELVEGVRSGTLNAAVTRPPHVADLASETLLTEPVAVALPVGHRLAGRAELTMAELAAEDWVLPDALQWPPWAVQHERTFAAAGFAPRVVRRAASVQSLLALVAAGVGVTRLAWSARTLRRTGVVFVPLTGQTSTVVVVWPAGRTHPGLAAFRTVLHEVAATVDPATEG